MTSQRVSDNKILKYIILDQNCDDLANILLHESLHHTYPQFQEDWIEHLTSLYWNHSLMRSSAQNRMVKVLSGYDL